MHTYTYIAACIVCIYNIICIVVVCSMAMQFGPCNYNTNFAEGEFGK